MEVPDPFEIIDMLGVLMFQTSDNSQLLRRVLWINAELTIVSSLKHKNTRPIYIFNRENPQNSEPQNGPRRGLTQRYESFYGLLLLFLPKSGKRGQSPTYPSPPILTALHIKKFMTKLSLAKTTQGSPLTFKSSQLINCANNCHMLLFSGQDCRNNPQLCGPNANCVDTQQKLYKGFS